MSNNQTYRQWKRFSDFKLLAEYAKISDFRESVMAWRRVQQVCKEASRPGAGPGDEDANTCGQRLGFTVRNVGVRVISSGPKGLMNGPVTMLNGLSMYHKFRFVAVK